LDQRPTNTALRWGFPFLEAQRRGTAGQIPTSFTFTFHQVPSSYPPSGFFCIKLGQPVYLALDFQAGQKNRSERWHALACANDARIASDAGNGFWRGGDINDDASGEHQAGRDHQLKQSIGWQLAVWTVSNPYDIQ